MTDSEKYHTESLKLITTSLIILNNLKKKDGSLFFKGYENKMSNIIDALSDPSDATNLIILSEKIHNEIKKMNDESNNIPNVIENKFFKQKINVSYAAIVDIETKAIPYINLDLGVIYATELDDFFCQK